MEEKLKYEKWLRVSNLFFNNIENPFIRNLYLHYGSEYFLTVIGDTAVTKVQKVVFAQKVVMEEKFLEDKDWLYPGDYAAIENRIYQIFGDQLIDCKYVYKEKEISQIEAVFDAHDDQEDSINLRKFVCQFPKLIDLCKKLNYACSIFYEPAEIKNPIFKLYVYFQGQPYATYSEFTSAKKLLEEDINKQQTEWEHKYITARAQSLIFGKSYRNHFGLETLLHSMAKRENIERMANLLGFDKDKKEEDK